MLVQLMTVVRLLLECIPHKRVCVRPDDQPWYDSAIRLVSGKRDRMKSTAKKTKKKKKKIGQNTKTYVIQ